MSCNFCFVFVIASWTWDVVDVMLYPCIFCRYCSVNRSVCLVGRVSDSVCKLVGETIRNMFGCVCYLVVECDVELLSVVGMQLLCILPFDILCLSAIIMMFAQILIINTNGEGIL